MEPKEHERSKGPGAAGASAGPTDTKGGPSRGTIGGTEPPAAERTSRAGGGRYSVPRKVLVKAPGCWVGNYLSERRSFAKIQADALS